MRFKDESAVYFVYPESITERYSFLIRTGGEERGKELGLLQWGIEGKGKEVKGKHKNSGDQVERGRERGAAARVQGKHWVKTSTNRNTLDKEEDTEVKICRSSSLLLTSFFSCSWVTASDKVIRTQLVSGSDGVRSRKWNIESFDCLWQCEISQSLY